MAPSAATPRSSGARDPSSAVEQEQPLDDEPPAPPVPVDDPVVAPVVDEAPPVPPDPVAEVVVVAELEPVAFAGLARTHPVVPHWVFTHW